jgi:hypothetical protein
MTVDLHTITDEYLYLEEGLDIFDSILRFWGSKRI